MRDRPELQALLEVQDYFRLPSPALVEKDWFVIKALTAIAAAPCAPFKLVFGGGTALARAHRLTKRMSEDIDLKIVGVEQPTRQALRALREAITDALLAAGFAFDRDNPDHRISRNESRYTVFNLPYEPIVQGAGALRPALKVEIAVWPLRGQSVLLPMSSFMAEARKQTAELPAIECVSVTQTAAEKFVALTRRTMAQASNPHEERDSTLVRHIYDLHAIRPHYDLAEIAALAARIMPHDAEVFGRNHEAYRADPLKETRLAIEALENDAYYRQNYSDFARDMVYGEVPDYGDAFGTLKAIVNRLPG